MARRSSPPHIVPPWKASRPRGAAKPAPEACIGSLSNTANRPLGAAIHLLPAGSVRTFSSKSLPVLATNRSPGLAKRLSSPAASAAAIHPSRRDISSMPCAVCSRGRARRSTSASTRHATLNIPSSNPAKVFRSGVSPTSPPTSRAGRSARGNASGSPFCFTPA